METKDEADLCFPQLFNSSCKKPASPHSELVLLHIMLSSISVLTVVLNLLVIISVSHFMQLHTPTNILLLSLAVSDFLVGLLFMPVEIFRTTACWVFGDTICVFYCLLSSTIICVSVGQVVLISVDRYVAICHPLHYPTRITVPRIRLSVCLCWLCCALYSSYYVKDVLTQPGKSKSCYGECVLPLDQITLSVDAVLNFSITVAGIIVLYLRVFVVAVSQARAMRSLITADTVQVSLTLTRKKSELKAARTLGVLVVVYLICYCPLYCYALIGDSVISQSFVTVVIFSFYLNSCLNPVIYALFYPWFRRSIKHIVTLQILKPGSREVNILERDC
ncbi:trace amine-associated receptor 13c-like [Mugil cephalus]|uniref:trace amine-associated receptor 13c-like n=1 Tax=Mugil cephalus TaxID=48193 RepID=UPI001FB7E8DE|nr:trace amine-associated receptor 13c-like [Mugil cephalus]